MKRSPMPPRSSPLRRVSIRRKGEASLDAAWRRAVRERDKTCQARALVPEVECWGPLHAHHRGQVSTHPQYRHDPANGSLLCASHHVWVHENPMSGVLRGLLLMSWEVPA